MRLPSCLESRGEVRARAGKLHEIAAWLLLLFIFSGPRLALAQMAFELECGMIVVENDDSRGLPRIYQ